MKKILIKIKFIQCHLPPMANAVNLVASFSSIFPVYLYMCLHDLCIAFALCYVNLLTGI